MPEEIFFLSVITVFSGTGLLIALIVTIAKHQRAKLEARTGAAGGSLTASELRRIIEEAVAQATRPLQEQLDDLEGLLRERGPDHRLPGARPERLLDAPDPTETEETLPGRSRVRA